MHINVSSWNIIVAISGNCLDIKQICFNIGFLRVIFLSENFLNELRLWEIQNVYNQMKYPYLINSEYPNHEKNMLILTDRRNHTPVFRILDHTNIELIQYCTLGIYERQFGSLRILSHSSSEEFVLGDLINEKVELYIATSHLDHMQINKSDGHLPIQVGASLTSMRKGYQTDCTDDNISLKNRDYCECTGLYWIWKNTSGQYYVGLEHYRRRLKLDTYDIIWSYKNNVDVVLALPQFAMMKVRDFFVNRIITPYDWQLMKDFVLEYDKDYEPILDTYDEAWFYFSCNLCLFKRIWFDRYCEFAFSIAFRIEDFYNQRGIIRQDRYMGYIFENLLSIFMMKHYKKMNVVCTEVEWIE